VLNGKSEMPDIGIHSTVGEMTNILTGLFDAKNAIATGNLHLAGNLELLRLVGQLFTERSPPAVHHRPPIGIGTPIAERPSHTYGSRR